MKSKATKELSWGKGGNGVNTQKRKRGLQAALLAGLVILLMVTAACNNARGGGGSSSADWAYRFVVWNGDIYTMTDTVVAEADVGEAIGEVTYYSDEEGTYADGFSNVYPAGTKLYRLLDAQTNEAIAVQDSDQGYMRAKHSGKYGGGSNAASHDVSPNAANGNADPVNGEPPSQPVYLTTEGATGDELEVLELINRRVQSLWEGDEDAYWRLMAPDAPFTTFPSYRIRELRMVEPVTIQEQQRLFQAVALVEEWRIDEDAPGHAMYVLHKSKEEGAAWRIADID
ncbi:hypothetical protein IDH44_00455 [Paenibacillus sp. IB182496]|uniref:Uncharacterized protein n=1 Tax=Paenibacillus sabuli TaxID=2772509 RepID=A0A927GPN1_9BACL|nr:hypothetical protein [Paenibacillus sabuli]MBD2843644.1 hypothetical protein [Paenibacillus sabuli]